MANGTTAETRVPALDGVRGLAIGLVLVYHFFAFAKPGGALSRVLVGAADLGVSGVDLFFLLSGFLITGILLDTRSRPRYFRNFYVRRALRIFPLYYGVLIAIFVVAPRLGASSAGSFPLLRQAEPWAWLYAVNVFSSTHGPWAHSYLDHFWSLSVEEHFYFVWPLVVLWLGENPRKFFRAALILAGLSRGARLVADLAGVYPVATYSLTFFRLDCLCLGGAVAAAVRDPAAKAWLSAKARSFAYAGVALLVASYGLLAWKPCPPVVAEHAQSLGLIGVFLFLVVSAAGPATASTRLLASAPLRFLGKYSYGLYVFHAFVSQYFRMHGTDVRLGNALGSHFLGLTLESVAGIGVSILIALVSYHLIERRCLALKDVLAPSDEAHSQRRRGSGPELAMAGANPAGALFPQGSSNK
jgi:peptidoglycan/LPS O-acetylase OafA/YrhL